MAIATIKGPAIFLAQFAGDKAPFNSLDSIAEWAASLGYKGIQIPSWDGRLFDLKKAAESQTYCDEVKGICAPRAHHHRALHPPPGPARGGPSGL
jgi:sugar phosphate isomerase/epimerase